MSLYENLEKYRLLTLELIYEVKKGGDLDFLIQERENILKAINENDFNKEEIKTIGSQLKLLELEDMVQDSIKKEKVKIMRELDHLKKTRQVNSNYGAVEGKSLILNKII